MSILGPMDPVMAVAAGVSVLFALVILLATSPHLYVLLTIGYVIFAPKLGAPIPGTTVLVRAEDIMVALLLVRVLLDLLRPHFRLPPAAKRIMWWLLAIIPLGLIGILVGVQTGTIDSPAVAALFLARRYEYFVMFLAGVLYIGTNEKSQRSLIRMLIVSVYFHLTLAVLQSTGVIGGWRFGSYRSDVTSRVISTAGGAYELAAYMVLLMPLFIWRLFKTPAKLSSLCGLAAAWVTLWLTQGRVAIVAGAIITVVMMLVYVRNKLVAVVVAIPAAIAVLFLAPTSASSSRFATVLNFEGMWAATVAAYGNRNWDTIDQFKSLSSDVEDRSYALRIDRWFSYWDGLERHNLWFGLGPSAGGENMDNNYLRMLFEFGVLGVLVFVILLVVIWKAARTIPDGPYRALATWGGLGLLIQATFIDVFEASKIAEPYWLILGVGIAIATTKAQQVSEAIPESVPRAYGR